MADHSGSIGVLRTEKSRLWIGLGLAQWAALGAFGWAGGLELPLPRLLLPAAALVCYAWAGAAAGRQEGSLAWVWGLAVLMRLSLLPLTPELSDDVYRYLWDGHVQLQGISPYLYPPGHAALEGLRSAWHPLINHPDVPTIYPPLAQLAFLLVGLLGGTVWSAKILWTAFDLLAGGVLIEAARRRGLPVARIAVLYLWSPLLIVETAWSAHFDALGLFWLSLALLWSAPPKADHPVRVGVAVGAATLTKFAPAALLPVLLRRYGVRSLLAWLLVVVGLYVPFVHVGLGPLTEGLRTYSEHWTANEGAFRLIAAVVEDPVGSRTVASGFVLAAVVVAAWRRFHLARAMVWIIGAGLLFSPTVHPWYVLWVLPAAALRISLPFLTLSGLVFLGYWGLGDYLTTGTWPEPGWAPFVIWFPTWLLLAGEARGWLMRRRARQAQAQEPESEQPDERGRSPQSGTQGEQRFDTK
ncbi:MAG: DUF2029 domain-containing protein [Gemmatimonadetes bacterium]|nr:DUF2029 domain-containing protein [Gemmatimonadota bacterium]